jgi:Bacterial alpha-L-rhamnosidase C-terminal domain
VKVEIPANTTATVKLPGGKVEEVGSGQYEFAEKN